MKLKNHHIRGIPGPDAVKSKLPVTTKIAISWMVAGTICITGYYFARKWALDQRDTNLETRRKLNDDFEKRMAPARAKVGV